MSRLSNIPRYDGGTVTNVPVPTSSGSGWGWLGEVYNTLFGKPNYNTGKVLTPYEQYQAIMPTINAINSAMNTTQNVLTGGADSSSVPIPELLRILTPIYGAEGAQSFILSDPQGAASVAAKLLSGTFGAASGGGGAGRTIFPWEQQAGELANQMTQEQLKAIQNPSSRYTNVNGYMVDRLTGQLVDPTDLGVNRYNANTSRFNADTQRQLADFTTGARFQEDQRQFDVNAQREALGQESLSRLQAAQGEGVLGNLGIDRAKFITDVLSKPSDTLARLYSQRGGTSPVQQITMADILNSFDAQTRRIGESTNANLSRLGGGLTTGFPAVKPQVPTPKVPVPTPQTAPAGFNSTDPNNPGGFVDPASDTYSNDGWYNTPEEQAAVMSQNNVVDNYGPGGADSYGLTEAITQLQNEANVAAGKAEGGYTRESRFIVGDQRSGKPTGHEELVVNPTNAPIAVVPNKMLPRVSRFAKGTNVPSRWDHEGNDPGYDPEKDPRTPQTWEDANGDNSVYYIMDALNQLRNGDAPNTKRHRLARYDEGTASWGGNANKYNTVTPQPTGGFLNSLREALSGLGDTIDQGAQRAGSRLSADINADPAGMAMGLGMPGGAVGSIDDVAKMFTRTTSGERIAHGLSKGVENFDPKQLLTARLENAMASYEKLAKGRGAANFKKMQDTSKEITGLRAEIEKMRNVAGPEAKRQAMMQSYTDSFHEMKDLRKIADDVVARESGGQFKTADEVDAALESAFAGGKINVDMLNSLRKLGELPAVKAYKDVLQRNTQLATEMGHRFGGMEGIDQITPGKSTADSIKEALGPSRFADGTLFSAQPTGTISPVQGYQTSNSPTYDLGYGGQTTQNELIDMSRLAAGPGANDVLSGKMPSYFRIPGLQTPTARQFNSLSSAEREALRPRLAAEFNSSLEDLMFNIEQRYGTNQSRMARFRG